MSGTTYTPNLRLHVPVFDQIPWDFDVNTNWSVLDAAVGMFTTIPNMVGAWKNATAYLTGQSVVDSADGSVWSCVISHTSSVAPGTFAQDRVLYPMYWTKISSAVGTYAEQAAASATAAAASAATAQAAAATAATAVPIIGGTMTGLLVLSGDPSNVLGAATKQYVDARVGGTGFLPTTGGTLTGALEVGGYGVSYTNQGANKHGISFGWTGSVIPVLVDGVAQGNLATQAYVNSGYLPITGGTIIGNLVISNSLGVGVSLPSDAPAGMVGIFGCYIRLSGYTGYNIYNRSGGGWEYGATGYGAIQYIDGSTGNLNILLAASGAIGGIIGPWAASYSFQQNGTFSCTAVGASGNVSAGNSVISYGSRVLSEGSHNTPSVVAWDTGIGFAGGLWISYINQINFGATDGNGFPTITYAYIDQNTIGFNASTVGINTNNGANSFCYGTSTDFNVPGQGWKPGGGVWATASDARIKDVTGEYTSGLSAICALHPVRFKYKDNLEAHKEIAASDKEFIGLIAQEAEAIMPEMFTKTEGEIGGVHVDDLRAMDATALPFACVNAIQELAARVAALEGK